MTLEEIKQSRRAKVHRRYELLNWFTWYDTQAIQYARDIRTHKKSNIDIAKLDKEAYQNAEEIKKINEELIDLREQRRIEYAKTR